MGIKTEKETNNIENAISENCNKTGKFKNNVHEVQLFWIERGVKWMDNYDLSWKRLHSLNNKLEQYLKKIC